MRIKRTVLAMILIVSLLQFNTASASMVENTSHPSVDVSFEEFCNNRDYYRALSREGYLVYVDVENIDKASVTQLISGNSTSSETLISNNSRSAYIPTSYWNVATQGSRAISGSSEGETLYSSVRFYGSTLYEIYIHNDFTRNLYFSLEGADLSAGIAPNKFLLYSLETASAGKNNSFYFIFEGPCSLYGSVTDIS